MLHKVVCHRNKANMTDKSLEKSAEKLTCRYLKWRMQVSVHYSKNTQIRKARAVSVNGKQLCEVGEKYKERLRGLKSLVCCSKWLSLPRSDWLLPDFSHQMTPEGRERRSHLPGLDFLSPQVLWAQLCLSWWQPRLPRVVRPSGWIVEEKGGRESEGKNINLKSAGIIWKEIRAWPASTEDPESEDGRQRQFGQNSNEAVCYWLDTKGRGKKDNSWVLGFSNKGNINETNEGNSKRIVLGWWYKFL